MGYVSVRANLFRLSRCSAIFKKMGLLSFILRYTHDADLQYVGMRERIIYSHCASLLLRPRLPIDVEAERFVPCRQQATRLKGGPTLQQCCKTTTEIVAQGKSNPTLMGRCGFRDPPSRCQDGLDARVGTSWMHF